MVALLYLIYRVRKQPQLKQMSVLMMPDDEDDANESSLNTEVGPMNHRCETYGIEKAEKSASVPCRALIFNHRQEKAGRRLHGRREKPLSLIYMF